MVKHLTDADFIFIESNHDLDLLQQYYNPNSLFHMSNPKTAQLLSLARKKSRKPPKEVMLGHISSQRNKPEIALEETRNAFEENEVDLDFELSYAPLREGSEVVEVE
jgi:phosphoribosyl 1,2-cyclic phosphodiesterase